MDGLEFLKRIQDSHPQAMKILITAYSSEDVVSKAIRIGINDFIDKPFTTKTIEDSLSLLLENRERNTSLMSSIEKNDRRDKEGMIPSEKYTT